MRTAEDCKKNNELVVLPSFAAYSFHVKHTNLDVCSIITNLLFVSRLLIIKFNSYVSRETKSLI